MRANLPNSAFAYVDARGRRRLPIHDEAHVRNALGRFSQVAFEDEAAREVARKRLLRAAKKYGIVPVGFITGQLESERELGRRRAREPVVLPQGFVTMVMTDVEGSTALVQRLGDRYRGLLNGLRDVLVGAARAAGGKIVETRADETFAVFEEPAAAVDMAIGVQRDLRIRQWDGDVEVRVRIGMHSGLPTQTDDNYIGLPVHAAARICAAAHGGQILVSRATRDAARGTLVEIARFRHLGEFRLRGIPEAVALYQVNAKGLAARFPPPRLDSSDGRLAPPGATRVRRTQPVT
jgi:class 3 adenylate cyclase